MTQQTIIVGGGQAAHCAALAMRRAGYEDRIVILGEEPARPYERPPLSKAMLTGDDPAAAFFCKETRYAEGGITLRTGMRVEGIDVAAARVMLANGERLAYDQLMFATGGRARQLGIPGGEHVRYLRTYADSRVVRAEIRAARRVVCIGAGVIGLEVAASAAALGACVTVVEAGSTIMGRCVAPDEADYISKRHAQAGVSVRLERQVVAVEAASAGKRIVLDDGEVLEADCVLAGIGMVRNTELAEMAGLGVDNGMMVDECGRTSRPGIYAAGDVAAFYHPSFHCYMRLESYYHAQGHGAAVGRVMAGDAIRYEDIPRFWTDQYDLNIQVAGAPLDGVCAIVRGARSAGRYTAFHIGQSGRIVGVTAVNDARNMRPALELIRSGRMPDQAALADPRVPLTKMAA